MLGFVLWVAVTLNGSPEPIAPGDQDRSVSIGGATRTYRLHVPASWNPAQPTSLVLALHPFAMNGAMMARVSGLSDTSDREGFLVAYPNGTGQGTFLHWNVGATDGDQADDVAYLGKVLDDIESVARVDPRKVYATGFSNGGMMCYRLASEMSDRIAAVAPVAGTMISGPIKASRPVPVLHFHGTEDRFVSYEGKLWRDPRAARLMGVEATIQAWARFNGCPDQPKTSSDSARSKDGLSFRRVAYGPGRENTEVILFRIDGGGHTWPGSETNGVMMGKVASDLRANSLIWDFFRSHPRP